MRQIVLDTETTGLESSQGHRIIEIGCVELLNRRFTGRDRRWYLNPEREIDEGAVQVHGITQEFLADKPRFADIAAELLDFITDAELVIHNAAFDVGFIDAEFERVGAAGVRDICVVRDTLELARALHPGQKNSLDALCRRYAVDNTHRELHGALLDARILADVFLAMTGGQISLSLAGTEPGQRADEAVARLPAERPPLPVIKADDDELAAHKDRLRDIERVSAGNCVWLRLEASYTE